MYKPAEISMKAAKNPGTGGHNLSQFGLALMVIGIGMFFFAPWWGAAFVLVVGIFLLSAGASRQQKGEQDSFEKACNENGFSYKPDLSNSETRLWIGVANNEEGIMAQFATNDFDVSRFNIDIGNVLNVELKVDDTSVYRAGPIASVAAAAAGGMAFGGAGAVVGAISAGGVGRGKIGRIDLLLRMDNIDQPQIIIPFIFQKQKANSEDTKARIQIAEGWTNLIEVLRFRIAKTIS